jgi:hypothetical protein
MKSEIGKGGGRAAQDPRPPPSKKSRRGRRGPVRLREWRKPPWASAPAREEACERRTGGERRETVGLQTPQGCACGACHCKMQQALRLPLERLQ